LGESIAARHLERLGYRIRTRNFRCALGEIDLVATKDEYLVFVEVKTRSEPTAYHPTFAVTAAKRERVRQLGELYRDQEGLGALQPRFDVVAVVLAGRAAAGPQALEGTRPKVEHYINAF
jgi:putative endonuclease